MFLQSFLEDNRRYRWMVGIPAEVTIYPDEISARRRTLPRFIPEFVTNQLESDDNLAQLQPPYRGLVVLIAETGLRVGDTCALPFDPCSPTARAGRACGSPARRCAPNNWSRCQPGRPCGPRPATSRPGQLSRRVGVAVPVTI